MLTNTKTLVVHRCMNNLGTRPASDTLRLRSKKPMQAGQAYPLAGVTVSLWIGLDPENEAVALFNGSTLTGDVTVLADSDPTHPGGIQAVVPASVVATAKREAQYFWKVRAVVSADEQFTLDDGAVRFSDKVI